MKKVLEAYENCLRIHYKLRLRLWLIMPVTLFLLWVLAIFGFEANMHWLWGVITLAMLWCWLRCMCHIQKCINTLKIDIERMKRNSSDHV